MGSFKNKTEAHGVAKALHFNHRHEMNDKELSKKGEVLKAMGSTIEKAKL
jgi:hypothetical protein